jgi:hypothetical protein
MSDALIALRKEMFSGEFADFMIVYAYEVTPKPLKISIDENQRNAGLSVSV